MRRKLIYVISVVLASALFQVNTANSDTDPSLVGWWRFDETSGTTAADSSGNGNDGELQGNPQWVPGKIDGALSFNGASDYVDCGDDATLTIQDEITMACWIKVPSFTRNFATIISRGDDSYRLSRGESNLAMHMGFNGTTSSPYSWFDGNTTVSDDEWHHVAGVYDGAEARIYIDGVLDASQAATGQINESAFSLYIGENAQATGRYWNGLIDDVRLYNRALTLEELELVMQGAVPSTATQPNPKDGADDVVREVVLTWWPGEFAAKHDVYFGTSFADVNAATASDHPNVEVSLNQDAVTYDPDGLLILEQTYYWRIDEVNDAHPEKLWKGAVWSFTVEPLAYPIENVTATASSSQSATMGPEKTVDGSGIDASDQHSTEVTDMWLTSATGPQPPWIKYDFGKSYRLREVWVWNYNSSAEPFVGFGLKDVTIQYSTDSVNWTQLSGVPDFAQGTGLPDYTYGTPVNFGDVEARYVMITANSNWSEGLQQYGLSEVRFFSIPVHARKPDPDSGATDVSLDVTLTWRAGREAAEHKVYVSDDMQAVADGTVDAETLTETSYSPPSLDLDKTYYWRVDEVNDSESPDTWEGDVWSFTTQQFLVVDDMESYNGLLPDDPDSNRIWRVWDEGAGYGSPVYPPIYCGNGTGSAVGDTSTDSFTEESIVHGGFQSMPYTYINDGTSRNICEDPIVEYYSEAELTFSPPQDWSRSGVKALTLWFYGEPSNDANATEQLYLKINDAKVAYDGDLTDIQRAQWHEWNVDLGALGMDLTNVTSLAIGFGDETNTTPGGSGKVLFDDIRLYPARCVPLSLKPAADLNNDCAVDYLDVDVLANAWLMKDQVIETTAPATTDLVGHWKLDDGSGTVAADSSGNGYDGTITGAPRWVTGQIGGALEFNGSTDYVDVADFNLQTRAITMTAWIRRQGDQPAWTGLIFHRSTSYTCGIGFSGVAGATNQLQYHWNYNNALTYNFESGLTVPDREWAFVALVIEESKATLYLNGLSETNAITHYTQTLADINLGRDAAGTYFRGLIDDARIYSRALSEAEIAYLADVSPDDGQLHVRVQSAAELYSAEPVGSQKVNLNDFTKLAQSWLEQTLWP